MLGIEERNQECVREWEFEQAPQTQETNDHRGERKDLKDKQSYDE